MCGIIGTTQSYNFDNSLLNTLSHRGPNDRGYFQNNKISLGHTRLSIIDHKGGLQPMQDNNAVLTYNGEIYNYKNLKTELIQKGIQFKTNSDTEVILKCYKEYGIVKTLRMLNGMFSFAIYDKTKNSIFIARDRVGIKPLFYSTVSGFNFCSEIKPLVNIIGKNNLSINHNALSMYFSCFYISAPLTIWNEINALEPGNYIEYSLSNKQLKKCCYWSIPICDRNEQKIDTLDHLLADATLLRMNSDVPFGAYLSGGVDSSLITRYMSGISQSKIKTFTAEIKDTVLNEKKYAQHVSDKYMTDHTVLPIEYENITIKKLKHLVTAFGQPFADSSMIPTYEISKKISQHITVAIGGDGADELFCGYNKYNNINKGIKNIFFRNPDLDNVLLNKYHSNIYEYMKQSVNYQGNDDLELLRLLDIRFFLEGDILQKVDRLSMINSLEVRVPFLDHRVIQYSSELKYNLMFNKVRKFPVKTLLEKDFSKDFVRRDKIGFMLDTNNFKQFLKTELKKRNTIGLDFVKSKIGSSNTYLSFALLIFKLWLEDNYES